MGSRTCPVSQESSFHGLSLPHGLLFPFKCDFPRKEFVRESPPKLPNELSPFYFASQYGLTEPYLSHGKSSIILMMLLHKFYRNTCNLPRSTLSRCAFSGLWHVHSGVVRGTFTEMCAHASSLQGTFVVPEQSPHASRGSPCSFPCQPAATADFSVSMNSPAPNI